MLSVLLIYVQLVLGAQLRHLPVTAPRIVFNISLILHLVNPLLVAATVILVGWTIGRGRELRALRRPARLLLVLFIVQVILGAATWVVQYGWPYWFSGYRFAAAQTIQTNSLVQAGTVTLHMALGSLILAIAVLLSLRSLRLLKAEAAIGCGALLLGMVT
jgi:cytochrome c oxidase assembly protein subunit 15